jgi:hypothetical protein
MGGYIYKAVAAKEEEKLKRKKKKKKQFCSVNFCWDMWR